ncbi:MAG: integrase [Campylobacterota bacterium]|nr:integrase [Campylobacterota bacterium]
MASIFPKRGKLWISLYLNGKRVQKPTGLEDTPKNRRRVEKDLEDLEYQVKSGRIKLDQKSKSFSYYAKVFIENKTQTLKPTTLAKYHSALSYIVETFGESDITNIKVSDVRKWVNTLLKTLKVKTVENYIIVLNGIFHEALYDEAIDKNPMIHIKLPSREKVDIEPFSQDEVGLMLKNTNSDFQNMIAVLAYTGVRVGECLGLKWDDINWNSREIYIQRTRNAKGEMKPKTKESVRLIPIFASLIPFLQNQYTKTGMRSEYVFVTQFGEPYFTSNKIMIYKWTPLLKSLGLKHRRLYDLRHTFATNMLNSGNFTAMQIAKWLGHTNTQMLFTKYARYIKSEQYQINKDFDLYGNHVATAKTDDSTKSVIA